MQPNNNRGPLWVLGVCVSLMIVAAINQAGKSEAPVASAAPVNELKQNRREIAHAMQELLILEGLDEHAEVWADGDTLVFNLSIPLMRSQYSRGKFAENYGSLIQVCEAKFSKMTVRYSGDSDYEDTYATKCASPQRASKTTKKSR